MQKPAGTNKIEPASLNRQLAKTLVRPEERDVGFARINVRNSMLNLQNKAHRFIHKLGCFKTLSVSFDIKLFRADGTSGTVWRHCGFRFSRLSVLLNFDEGPFGARICWANGNRMARARGTSGLKRNGIEGLVCRLKKGSSGQRRLQDLNQYYLKIRITEPFIKDAWVFLVSP